MRNNFSLKFKSFDILIMVFSLFAIVTSIVTTNFVFADSSEKEKIVQIYYQGKLIKNLQTNLQDVTNEKTIVLEKDDYDGLLGNMIILINKDKGVCISEVTCPNHTCEKQGWVKSVGYPVVCIPNGVYVIITSSSVDEGIILG